ncbi:C3a anaphylatoxin chemotactic receptor-like [Haliotis rufescens]|uniref:C3a anaphylatoxin chemotactic receptor-like n=1 Tax=Haliotis rufescens TaxID=6454 RepID=UPI001EB0A556|nr:C3a anaphylatoxin chemotactic receptor-like [Haliotis rufescens]
MGCMMYFRLKPNETLSDLSQRWNMDTLYRPLTGEMVSLIVILSVFTIVGSVGNGLVIFVFQKIREKTTAHVFIITLAVIDLFACMVIIPFTIVVEYLRYDIRYDFLCKLYQFLITSEIPLSAFIMVAIAFDRYFCICHPLKTILTPKRTKIVIGCLTLFACTLGIVTALAFGVYQRIVIPDYSSPDLDENSTIPSITEPRIFSMRPMADESPKENDINKLLMSRVFQYMSVHNITRRAVIRESGFRGPYTTMNMYIGICQPTQEILSFGFVNIYQKVYSSLYLFCLVIVGVLYGMIYKFITSRRSRKLQQKLTMCTYINGENGYEATRLTLLNGHDEEKQNGDNEQMTKDRGRNASGNRNSGRHYEAERLREETRAANIKTALMLFAVTVVFIVAFLPAWLMTYRIVPTVIVVFYSYFVYNVANPFIYAFMNHIFKDNIHKIFSC